AIEARRHRRKLRFLDRDEWGRLNPQKLTSTSDHRLARCGVIVAHVVDRTGIWPRRRSAECRNDIVDVNARKDMARLGDPPCRTRAHRVDGTTAGPVDARKTENMHRQIVHLAECQPAGFCLHALARAGTRRRQRRTLIDFAAIPIAVDPGGREVADPLDSLECGDVAAMAIEYCIPLAVGWHRG